MGVWVAADADLTQRLGRRLAFPCASRPHHGSARKRSNAGSEAFERADGDDGLGGERVLVEELPDIAARHGGERLQIVPD